MKKILIALVIVNIKLNAFSLDFANDYDSVIQCGPKKENSYEQAQLNPFKHFVINKDIKGRFIVWTNNYQYPSFDEINYYEIYNQIGGKTSSKLEKYGNIEKYFLYRNDGKNLETRVLMVDKSNLTFISRIGEYEPTMGICWYPAREK